MTFSQSKTTTPQRFWAMALSNGLCLLFQHLVCKPCTNPRSVPQSYDLGKRKTQTCCDGAWIKIVLEMLFDKCTILYLCYKRYSSQLGLDEENGKCIAPCILINRNQITPDEPHPDSTLAVLIIAFSYFSLIFPREQPILCANNISTRTQVSNLGASHLSIIFHSFHLADLPLARP